VTPGNFAVLHIKSGRRIGGSLVIGFVLRSDRPMVTESKRAQIIEALQSNPNGSAVARQVGGVKPDTVRSIARKLGIDLRVRTKVSPQARAKIAAALRINPNASAVARKIGGMSSATVRIIAKKANIRLAAATIGKTKRLSPERRAQIVEALEANPNASMVARQVGGVSSRTVQKIAKQAKIEVIAVNGHGTPALSLACKW
jgi:transposase-like protein